ncbi:LapA family protein [Pseudoxanthomonas dokdonensis]|uniref:Membrane protein n=1 Tax=Pseudoxanthomonas dokdonensis TaxID=344882 RepID=A0A0R0CMH2_9GAMM|nr:LapA family protein [Pseudoxanthomonas dokdonensis]KRG71119.1 membrane protein [Pseudoxanthomonas dokdonensis]
MNSLRLVIALLVLAVGIVIGVLNTQPIQLNLLFSTLQTSSGVAIIVSLLLGVIIGGLLTMITLVMPMYARLRKATRAPGYAAGSKPSSPPPSQPGH